MRCKHEKNGQKNYKENHRLSIHVRSYSSSVFGAGKNVPTHIPLVCPLTFHRSSARAQLCKSVTIKIYVSCWRKPKKIKSAGILSSQNLIKNGFNSCFTGRKQRADRVGDQNHGYDLF